MRKFSKKGYKTIVAKDPNTGLVFNAPVPAHGKLAGIEAHNQRKRAKAAKEARREYKKHLRAVKKGVPIEHRAKVKWFE